MTFSRIIYLAVWCLLLFGISIEDLQTHTIRANAQWSLLVWVLLGHLTNAVLAATANPGAEPDDTSGLFAARIVLQQPDKPYRIGFQEGLISAASMTFILIVCSLVWLRLRGAPPIGGGDIRLLATGALALGFDRVCLALCIASAFAAVAANISFITNAFIYDFSSKNASRDHSGRILRLRSQREIPFAPFISMGLVITYIFGDTFFK